jgi:TPR repeat protein
MMLSVRMFFLNVLAIFFIAGYQFALCEPVIGDDGQFEYIEVPGGKYFSPICKMDAACASFINQPTKGKFDELLKKAKAEPDNPSILYVVASIYEIDDGYVEKDFNIAFDYYLRSAKLGLADAQHKVGYFYSHGMGVSMNKESALNWYQLASEQGFVSSMFNYATISLKQRIKGNYPAVKRYLYKLASINHPSALFYLGQAFVFGTTIETRDFNKAQFYLSKSAKLGNMNATATLGVLYKHGAYGEDKKSLAGPLLNAAAASGNGIAIRALNNKN